MTTVVTALLPIVVTITLGFFAGWHKDFSQEQSAILNRMVMLYALPMNLIVGILTIKRSMLMDNLSLFLWLFIAMVGGYFLFMFIFHFFVKNTITISAIRALLIAGPAVPFVGTSVLSTIFNTSDATLAIAIASILMNLIQVPITLVILSSHSKRNSQSSIFDDIKDSAKEPVVWAPILSFILVLIGVELPHELKESFSLLGAATGGVALFASGAILYAQKVSISRQIIFNIINKNIVFPLILMILMIGFNSESETIDLATISMAIPSASIPIILSVQYKVYEKEAASTLFFSTVLSILTMGVFIYFLVMYK